MAKVTAESVRDRLNLTAADISDDVLEGMISDAGAALGLELGYEICVDDCGDALKRLLKVNLAEKRSFPEDTLILPDKLHDREIVRRRLRDVLKREPTEQEINEELTKPEYKGVNLVQLCAYLVEAVKELEKKIQAIEKALS